MTKTIDNKYLDRGDLFGLEYRDGLVFFSVRGYSEPRYQPYTQLGQIDPQSSLDRSFQRLEDEQGDDIIHLEKDSSSRKILHVGIGQKPAFIRRYTRYPDGGPKMSSFPNTSTPSVGDPSSYVDGDESPYGNPTDARELMIPPGFHLTFNFHNPHPNKTASPTLDIKTRLYEVEPIDPRGSQDERDAVRRIVRPGGPAPVYPVGTINNRQDYNMNDRWGVNPVPASRINTVV